MSDSRNPRPEDPALNQIIASYLIALDSGQAPDREQLLRDHPEYADSLKAFFANHDHLRDSAPDSQELPTIAPSSSLEEPTIPPSPNAGSSEDATVAPSSTSDAPAVGAKVRYFGDYELLEEIARGGMGVVYKARQTELNRIVALKMILAGQLAGEEDVQRFHAEAEAAAQAGPSGDCANLRSW